MMHTIPKDLEDALQIVTAAYRRARTAETLGPTPHFKTIRRALEAAEAAERLGATEEQITTAMGA